MEGAKRDTRQYTKRQATWFRNQLPDFAWVEPEKALAAVEGAIARPGEVTWPAERLDRYALVKAEWLDQVTWRMNDLAE